MPVSVPSLSVGRRLGAHRAVRRADRVRAALARIPSGLLSDPSWDGVQARAAAFGVVPGEAYGRWGTRKALFGSEPYVGEIMVTGYTFSPNGWLDCNGQVLSIAENDVLFVLLGTTYGGDGQETFGLPDLQGRFPMHASPAHVLGESAGVEAVTLTTAQMPAHAHAIGTTAVATANTPALTTVPAAVDASTAARYSTTAGVGTMAATGIAGGSQPHTNLPPYLGLRFSISLWGIFPSQS